MKYNDGSVTREHDAKFLRAVVKNMPTNNEVMRDLLYRVAARIQHNEYAGEERTDWTNTACPFCPRCGYPDPLDSPRNGSPMAKDQSWSPMKVKPDLTPRMLCVGGPFAERLMPLDWSYTDCLGSYERVEGWGGAVYNWRPRKGSFDHG